MKLEGIIYDSKPKHHFASDNNTPAHPDIVQAIIAANQGHTLGYGEDYYTEKTKRKIREVFGCDCEPFFVFTGTAANVLSLTSLARSYEAVICAEPSHINTAECAALENYAGIKIFSIPSPTGKITTKNIATHFNHNNDEHHAQPKVVSLTQTTDFGLCYTTGELKEICDFAHKNNMYVHVDGARIYNACAKFEVSLKEMITDTGIDVLSCGGTKNGLMGAETVIFLKPELSTNFKYIRKQGMQLASKMRFLAVQVEALLSNDLWYKNASQANKMGKLLYNELIYIPEIKITRVFETNMIFCDLSNFNTDKILEKYLFHFSDVNETEARFVTSYDTTEENIYDFVNTIKKSIKKS